VPILMPSCRDTLSTMPLRVLVLVPVARLVRLLALVLLTYATPAAANEQRRFVLFNEVVNQNPQRYVAHLWEATIVDGRVVSVVPRVTIPGFAIGSQGVSLVAVTVAAGGRFVVWRQSTAIFEGLAVFDRLTGQASVVVGVALSSGLGVSDPTRPRLLAPYRGEIASVSVGGVAILPNSAGLFPRAISRDGRRLYAIRSGIFPTNTPVNVRELVVLDSTTGEHLRTVEFPDALPTVPAFAVTDDESKVWLVSQSYFGTASELHPIIRAFDLSSGSQTLAISLPSGFNPRLIVDDAGQRVAVSFGRLQPAGL
jgi:hypothetical protein